MPAYPGFPGPHIGALFTHEASRSRYGGFAEFYVGKVAFTCNAGTYLGSPFHRYRDGADLSQTPLYSVTHLPGIILEWKPSSTRAVNIECREAELHGRAILFHTSWDARWGTES